MTNAYFGGLANICHSAHNLQNSFLSIQKLDDSSESNHLNSENLELRKLLSLTLSALKTHEENTKIYDDYITKQNEKINVLDKYNENLSQELDETINSYNILVDKLNSVDNSTKQDKIYRVNDYNVLRNKFIDALNQNSSLKKDQYVDQKFNIGLLMALKVVFINLSAIKNTIEHVDSCNSEFINIFKEILNKELKAKHDEANMNGKQTLEETLLFLKDEHEELYEKIIEKLI